MDNDHFEMSRSKLNYIALVERYKEIVDNPDPDKKDDTPPYDIKVYLTQIKSESIDIDYMNSRFEKYIQVFKEQSGKVTAELEKLETDLHKTFSCLSRLDQKFADILLRDIQRGVVEVQDGKTFRDYITDYATKAQDDKVHRIATALGLDEAMLRELKNSNVSEADLNKFGRFDALKATVDKTKAQEFFDSLEQPGVPRSNMPMFMVNIKINRLLTDFILRDIFIENKD